MSAFKYQWNQTIDVGTAGLLSKQWTSIRHILSLLVTANACVHVTAYVAVRRSLSTTYTAVVLGLLLRQYVSYQFGVWAVLRCQVPVLGPVSISEKTSFRKVAEPRNLYFKLSDRSEIWQALRQQCCRCACQISKRYNNSKYQSRGFETLRDLPKRRLFGYWDGVLVSLERDDLSPTIKIKQYVCMYGMVCMSMCVYVCANVRACMHLYIYIYISSPGLTRETTCLLQSKSNNMYVCMVWYVCLCVYMFVRTCVHACMHLYIYIYIYIFPVLASLERETTCLLQSKSNNMYVCMVWYVCLCVYMFVRTCVHACMHAFVYISIYACINVWMNGCMCIQDMTKCIPAFLSLFLDTDAFRCLSENSAKWAQAK